jgi:hypothetical protein
LGFRPGRIFEKVPFVYCSRLSRSSNRFTSNPTMSKEPTQISLIPDAHFYNLRAEVEALPPRKGVKWHSLIRDTNGVLSRVYFANGKLIYTKYSKLITLRPFSDRQRINCVKHCDPRYPEQERRVFRAFENGGLEAAEEEHELLVDEAATGGHRSKSHKIRVPTKAGEPVRA